VTARGSVRASAVRVCVTVRACSGCCTVCKGGWRTCDPSRRYGGHHHRRASPDRAGAKTTSESRL
jgi:hypothetical protein